MADATKEYEIAQAFVNLICDARTPLGDRVDLYRTLAYDEDETFPRCNVVPGGSELQQQGSALLVYEYEVATEIAVNAHDAELPQTLRDAQAALVGAIMRQRGAPVLGLDYVRDVIPSLSEEISRDDGGTASTVVRAVTWNVVYQTTEDEMANG